MERNLQILDTELAKNGNSEYRMKELLNWRVDTMASLGVDKTTIDQFWTQYRHLPFVREREINRLLDEKDYDSAIRLLRESKELDKRDDFQVRGYSQKMIDIYQQTGQTEPLREELRFQDFQLCPKRFDIHCNVPGNHSVRGMAGAFGYASAPPDDQNTQI